MTGRYITALRQNDITGQNDGILRDIIFAYITARDFFWGDIKDFTTCNQSGDITKTAIFRRLKKNFHPVGPNTGIPTQRIDIARIYSFAIRIENFNAFRTDVQWHRTRWSSLVLACA